MTLAHPRPIAFGDADEPLVSTVASFGYMLGRL